MSHIYWDLPEIPIPDVAHVNNNDGRVFLLTQAGDGKRRYRRDVIGRVSSANKMHPNTLFKSLFPNLWVQYYGIDRVTPNVLYCGLYLLSLTIVHKNGLYKCLIDAFGAKIANALIDYAIYTIKHQSTSM